MIGSLDAFVSHHPDFSFAVVLLIGFVVLTVPDTIAKFARRKP